MDLTDKVAVVTGASSGLGLHFARLLLEQGAHVFGLARSADRLSELRDELGDRFHPVPCDVTDEAQVAEAFRTVEREGGRLDVLINNAGLGKFGPVDDLPPDHWAVQLDTNLTGVFFCTRRAVPMMKRQNEQTGFGGHIVNIASVAGLVGNPQLTAYNTTKFGLRGFSEALMKEVREDGIKVTCVYPGSVETNFSNVADSNLAPNPMQPEDVAATVLHVLQTPENYLISEVVMRPLRPKG
ncbi:MAG: SDR family NAD(P)-dependent oxidoreductase [Rhodothermales bacterium]|nr:SDR family NAD(P)-dependent oxidoreductase [Rhodothermales bacterium]